MLSRSFRRLVPSSTRRPARTRSSAVCRARRLPVDRSAWPSDAGRLCRRRQITRRFPTTTERAKFDDRSPLSVSSGGRGEEGAGLALSDTHTQAGEYVLVGNFGIRRGHRVRAELLCSLLWYGLP